MNKKFGWIAGTLMLALLVVGAFGTTVAYADDGGPQHPVGQRGDGFDGKSSLDGAALDTVAELLGMTPEEVTAAIQDDGKTLKELADEAGVDMQDIKDALSGLHDEAMRERIETALDEGTLIQDEADWLLEGLDQGYLGKLGNFFSRRGGHGGH